MLSISKYRRIVIHAKSDGYFLRDGFLPPPKSKAVKKKNLTHGHFRIKHIVMDHKLYKRRRLRSTQPILTRVQIRDIGKSIGYTSFRKSVEFLMVRIRLNKKIIDLYED